MFSLSFIKKRKERAIGMILIVEQIVLRGHAQAPSLCQHCNNHNSN